MFWKMDYTHLFKKIIEICTYVSFLLANAFIIIIFNSYLHINEQPILRAIVILLTGILLSATTINPRWLLRAIDKYTDGNLNQSLSFLKENVILHHIYFFILFGICINTIPKYIFSNHESTLAFKVLLTIIFLMSYSLILYYIFSIIKKHIVDFIKFTMLSIRYLFFSILNDVFILNIFWICFLFVVYTLSLVQLPSDFNMSEFAVPITLISILSGLFKLYTDSYKNQIHSNAVKPLTQYIQDFVQEVNPKDFLEFLKKEQNCDKAIIIDFNDFIYGRNFTKNRAYKYARNNKMHAYIEPLDMFRLFDNHVKQTNKKYVLSLNDYYKQYFHQKLLEFNNELKQFNFVESRTLLFSGVFLLNDLYTDVTTVNEPYKKHKRKIRNFMDCYNQFVRQCTINLMSYVMNSEFSHVETIKVEDL